MKERKLQKCSEIEAYNSETEAKTLKLNDHLFHEALREEPESKTRFHVLNDKGEDFDIVYWDNEDDIEPTAGYPKYVKRPFIAKYPFYDETEVGDTFYIDWYQGFHEADYIRAMRDTMAEMGMKGLRIERVE